jgi:hypothetical protein
MADLIINQLLIQATACVIIGGDKKGTAWLVSDDGELLTAGHVVKDIKPNEIVSVRFSGEIYEQRAELLGKQYNKDEELDFAVLKLQKTTRRFPLPISLETNINAGDEFLACGFGSTLDGLSPGTGQAVGIQHPNPSNNKLFHFVIKSDQFGDPGYSGAAIFSLSHNAVIGIQIRATDPARVEPGTPFSNAAIAMPLIRMVEHWKRLIQIEKEYPKYVIARPYQNVDDKGIVMLCVYEIADRLGKESIPFSEAKNKVTDDFKRANKRLYDLFALLEELQRNELVKFAYNKDIQSGVITLSDAGRVYVQDLRRVLSETSQQLSKQLENPILLNEVKLIPTSRPDSDISLPKPIAIPKDFEELLSRSEECLHIVKRTELVGIITEKILQKDKRVFALCGQPLIGKTTLLGKVEEELVNYGNTILLKVDAQKLLTDQTENFDILMCDLLHELHYEATELYNRLHLEDLRSPSLNYTKFSGNWKKQFLDFWNEIILKSGDYHIVIIIDEVGHFATADFSGLIFMFLGELLRDNNKVTFIFSGLGLDDVMIDPNYEYIRVSVGNNLEILPVSPLSDVQIAKIISLVQNSLSFSTTLNQPLQQFCDGFLIFLIEAVNSLLNDARSYGDLQDADFREILTQTAKKNNQRLTTLWNSLTPNEQYSLWIISNFKSINNYMYSIYEFNLNTSEKFRFLDGIQKLIVRGWIDWEDVGVKFEVKLGILLVGFELGILNFKAGFEYAA